MVVHIPQRIPADLAVRASAPPAFGFPLFAGFPYLVTRLVPVLCHFTVLPAHWSANRLRELARQQVRANRLPTALVLDADFCLYLTPAGGELLSAPMAGQAMVMLDSLRLPQSFDATLDLARRAEALEAFRNEQPDQRVGPSLELGGWQATERELRQFAGKNPDGSPKGLTQCVFCRDWRGICLDPTDALQLMQVYCQCENWNRCARCGEFLHDYRLNANYYDTIARGINYAPGYKVMWHSCRE